MLCVQRQRGTSEEQIAEQLGFGSVEDMRIQLENWDLPEWLTRGNFGGERGTTQDRNLGKKRGKRKAKTTGGPVQELPPSKGAAPLFEEALGELRHALKVLVYLQSGGRHTPEYLQDGRFIQNTREEAPLWAPDVGGGTRIAGATQAPGNGLTELIAAYLVAGGDPEPLIEKLHHDPDELDREKLGRVLYGDKKNGKPGLFTRCVHAARLIRGADVEAGASTGEFDVEEMATRHRTLDMRAAGLTDRQIIEAFTSEGSPISMPYLKRLAGFEMPEPPK
jgi:hypothetical protein